MSYDKHTGRPRGFGFVVFADPIIADKVRCSPASSAQLLACVWFLTTQLASPASMPLLRLSACVPPSAEAPLPPLRPLLSSPAGDQRAAHH